MKKATLLFVALFAGEGAPSRSLPQFVRSCDVRVSVLPDSPVVCRARAADFFQNLPDSGGDFRHVKIQACEGFVPQSCLATASASVQRSRRIASFEALPFVLGVGGASDLASASVSYSSGMSLGYGVGGEVHFGWQPYPAWQVTGGMGLRCVSLSRTLDGTGSITDPDPITYQQTYTVLTVQSDVAYAFISKAGALHWFVEGGLEFWLPLSATQTDSHGNTTSFSAPDHPLLLTAGPALAWPLADAFELRVNLRPFYNVLATGGSRLYGLRLGVALNWRI